MNSANDPNPIDFDEEQSNFLSILAAFKHYREYAMNRVNTTEMYLNTLPNNHQELMFRYREHLNNIRKCIDDNHQIIRKIIQDVDSFFANLNQSTNNTTSISAISNGAANVHVKVRCIDLDKVQVTLKQFVRDWSSDGEEERRQSYKPIIDEIERFYNANEIDISEVKILVPGAGLGRLTYEFARRGFYSEGNEFSLFMIIASNFVLNKCMIENQYTIYPWVHQYVNNLTRHDQVRSITFPDVSPTQSPPKGTFNMVAGDFLQVYTQEKEWDCVATCFFIDCANNVAEFVENIYKILKPGGIWVNLGPLLYHYSDVENECSIEPTYEDLVLIIKGLGFEIVKNETGIKTKYSQNLRSMLRSEYESVFFVCKKPIDIDAAEAFVQNGETHRDDVSV